MESLLGGVQWLMTQKTRNTKQPKRKPPHFTIDVDKKGQTQEGVDSTGQVLGVPLRGYFKATFIYLFACLFV